MVIVPAEASLLRTYVKCPEESCEFDVNIKLELMLKVVFAVPIKINKNMLKTAELPSYVPNPYLPTAEPLRFDIVKYGYIPVEKA